MCPIIGLFHDLENANIRAKMRIRQWLYKEHYYRPVLTQSNIDYLRVHLGSLTYQLPVSQTSS